MCSSIYMVKLNFECNKDIFAYVLQGISFENYSKVKFWSNGTQENSSDSELRRKHPVNSFPYLTYSLLHIRGGQVEFFFKLEVSESQKWNFIGQKT